MSKLLDVMAIWQNDIQFRSEFKKNPIEALKKAQIELTPSDLEKIQKMIDSQSDDLDERISK